MGFWGLEKGAPIVCFRAFGAKGPSRALNRELGRGGAAVKLVGRGALSIEGIDTLRADVISHHRDRDLDIAA